MISRILSIRSLALVATLGATPQAGLREAIQRGRSDTVDLVALAALAGQEGVGLLVPRDLPGHRIPSQLAVQPHRDVGEVAELEHGRVA